MHPRVKSGVLWGAVGALAFLVLVQGYRLVGGGLRPSLPVVLGVALAVGVLSAVCATYVEGRLAGR